MGQVLRKLHDFEQEAAVLGRAAFIRQNPNQVIPSNFPNLSSLPPEVALLVLSNLNATDLCLASCVWDNLASDEFLWHSLCRSQWGQVSAYRRFREPGFSFKKLYLQLDEATLTFNADPDLGLEYVMDHGLVNDDPMEIARFLHTARQIDWAKMGQFLQKRKDVLERVVELQSFKNQFLPNALRRFFRETNPPNERNDYLNFLIEKFSERFCECNPSLGLNKDTVYVACYSLLMLSVDLCSPHVKNKMSKREFIRNTRQAAQGINDEFAGHLYDNIYLVGHIAPKA